MAAREELYSKVTPRRNRQQRPGTIKHGSALDVLLSMGFPRARAAAIQCGRPGVMIKRENGMRGAADTPVCTHAEGHAVGAVSTRVSPDREMRNTTSRCWCWFRLSEYFLLEACVLSPSLLGSWGMSHSELASGSVTYQELLEMQR
ncbi:Ubiquitin-associated and SH3 domain-containing protein B [Tupaia chinensis]|uniref:Ubiquitin-associated and SH3 domain-containing protein B n=1 Tax=Tupaia chinensis TaxID=246437 RepID=L9KT31_TUPCH|nr:Ubiquitin-associated and SH3 domain-containing protein B [Tupaia chinensis]